MKKMQDVKRFLEELGIEILVSQGNLWLKREHVEDLGGEGDVLALILTTFGKGFMWNKSEEMMGWFVLTSVY